MTELDSIMEPGRPRVKIATTLFLWFPMIITAELSCARAMSSSFRPAPRARCLVATGGGQQAEIKLGA